MAKNDQELVPIDPRRAEQSVYTSGDPDTGLPDPSHQDPVILTGEEIALGREAINAIRRGESIEPTSGGKKADTGGKTNISAQSGASPELETSDLNKIEPATSSSGDEIPDQKVRNVGHVPKSWLPTIPFERLTREIGHAPDPRVESVPLTRARQDKIFQWQLRVKKPYDLIQRAEGKADANNTYWGAGNRIKDLSGSRAEQAAVKSSAGRAAIYGLYERTIDHRNAAKDRLAGATRASQVLGWNTDRLPSDEDMLQLVDSLQELGNDIAANMDNLFPGGNEQARVAGNSVIAFSEAIRTGRVVDLRDYKLLYKAAVSNSNGQVGLWEQKIAGIHDFCRQMQIDLSSAAS